MDQKTKNILIIVGVVIVAAIILQLIFRFLWPLIILAIAFGAGYYFARRKKR
ncbi:MAG: hypothetical protein WDZ35_07345 [Crocinitomicaceae bacterium]